MLTESCKKVAFLFCCSVCHYKTSRKSSYSKHLMTSKHIKLTSVNKNNEESCKKVENENENENENDFTCDNCEKIYKSRVGLWKHNKVCKIEKEGDMNNKSFDITNVQMLTNMVFEVVKQNSETQKQNQDLINKLYELSKNSQITNNTTNNNNSHNQ